MRDSARWSAASTSSLARAAVVVVRTRRPCSQAARPRPISRWVLPVPLSPSSTTGSPFSRSAPVARPAGGGGGDGAAPGGAVVELGGQDLGEVGQVGGVFPGGDLGQPGGLVADGGQLELAGRGADGGLGGGVGHGGHGMVLVSSWSEASRAGAGRS